MIVIASSSECLRRSCRDSVRECDRTVEVADVESLRDVLRRLRECLVFVDPQLEGSDGLITVRSLCHQYRDIPFIVFGVEKANDELEYLRAGVRGYLTADRSPVARKVAEAIWAGELWISRSTIRKFLEELGFVHSSRPWQEGAQGDLSEREWQVARLVTTGASNKEVAKALGITERTVKAHMSHIFRKLGITQRSELFWFGDRVRDSRGKPRGPEGQPEYKQPS